ncbi:MAG: SPFH domain-containing protein [Bacilli bacterium]|nr:SPFH domain-containing protein [Bacilli bacterium]
MGVFLRKKKGGLSDVIRCEEKDYLVYKWKPSSLELHENKREYAIRTKSILRVRDGEAAIFFYKQKDGKLRDIVYGPYDDVLKTKNFPILSSLIGLFYEGDTPFQAEIYFVNLSKSIQIKFGIPYFDVFDPFMKEYSVPVCVRGTFTFKISNIEDFISNYRLENFTIDELRSKISDVIVRATKKIICNFPSISQKPVIQIEQNINDINEEIFKDIKSKIDEIYSIEVVSLDIGNIEIDKESDEYKTLISLTKDITTKKTLVKTDLEIKKAYKMQDINLEDYEQRLKIEREATKFQKEMEIQHQNIDVLQVGANKEVGIASAEAFGKMGENGGGNVNIGGESVSGTGFNPATFMTSVAVGKALGETISKTMTNSMDNKESTNNSNINIPPIPTKQYYYALNNNPLGPFKEENIKELLMNNTLNKDTLIWIVGTSSWVKLSSLDEFKGLIPPEIK